MNLIINMEKPLQNSFVIFLRSQQCGFENGYPKVCCNSPHKKLEIVNRMKSRTPTSNGNSTSEAAKVLTNYNFGSGKNCTGKLDTEKDFSRNSKLNGLKSDMEIEFDGRNFLKDAKNIEKEFNVKNIEKKIDAISDMLTAKTNKKSNVDILSDISEYSDAFCPYNLFRRRRKVNSGDFFVTVEIR